MKVPLHKIALGSSTERSIIALYLTPEEAHELADLYGSSDGAFAELHEAADHASALLGEDH